MKRLQLSLGASLGALLLCSCYAMTIRPTGTIKLDFAGQYARTISSTATVRVYLYTYSSSSSYSLYTFPSGKQYDSFQYGSGSATISNIPAGKWEVLVSVGTVTNGFFQVSNYGNSSAVDVVGGQSTPASITTQTNPLTYSSALTGTNLTAAVFDYSAGASSSGTWNLYVANSNALYAIPASSSTFLIDLSTSSPSQISLPSGLSINSLAEGGLGTSNGSSGSYYDVGCVFINSNEGIVPYQAGSFDTSNFSYALAPTAGGTRYSILHSAAWADYKNYATAIVYGRNQGLGGVYFNESTAAPYSTTYSSGASWVDVDQSSQVSSNDVYEISTDAVYHDATGYAYFATKLGAFRADPTFVTAGNANAGKPSSTVAITAPNGATITAIAVDDYDNVLYIGTSSGAYYATLTESDTASAISGSWTAVPETAGDSIVSIKVDQSDGQLATAEAVAFRSASSNVYAFSAPPGQGGTEATFPFYSGVPGTVNAMDFGFGVLFLAGSEGLASYTIGALPPF